MRVKEKSIVLQNIRHGDKKCILKLYTEHHGLISAIASVGKSGKVRSSTLFPLTLVHAELIIKQNKELHLLTETSCYFVTNGFADSIAKLSIAQFLNEILIKTLKEQGASSHLFDFIETCIKFLNDAQNDFVNLHLYFLLELSKYLGFEPQNNFSKNNGFFDCREGKFSPVGLAFPLGLNAEASKLFSDFLEMNILQTKITNLQRQELLESLLAYYKLHIPSFNEVRSVEVLKTVMQ